jgi:Protein of unknown function (DUF1036)
MKRASVIAVGVCGALCLFAIGFLGPRWSRAGAQQQDGQKFEIAFCNISAFTDVAVALMYKQDAQRWWVAGWYALPDGGCSLLGSFLRDSIYYYAEGSKNSVWRAADNDQTAASKCVDHDKAFEGDAGAPACPQGQSAVRFKLLKIPAGTPRLTWTLTGGK